MCSYPATTPEKPSLLDHRGVRILFHELGHAIHHFADQTRYATGQSRDFGEIPSVMLENFVWIPEVMVRLSRHYTALPGFVGSNDDSSEGEQEQTIPLDLARAVARTKYLHEAIGLLGLTQKAMFDLAIYTPRTHEEAAEMDITAVWSETLRCCFPYKHPGGIAQVAQTLFYRGYDAAYFTYLT